MSPEELGLLVTGLHGIKGEAKVFDANIAKERQVEIVFCDKVDWEGGKELQKVTVEQHFLESKYSKDGWEIQDHGTSSQQNQEKHKYVIKRYVDVENPLETERYY